MHAGCPRRVVLRSVAGGRAPTVTLLRLWGFWLQSFTAMEKGVEADVKSQHSRVEVEVEVAKRNIHRISTPREKVELAEAKPTVARLAALVHTPAFDGVDPATDERLVSLGYEIKERSTHDLSRGQEAVVRAIVDRAEGREPVKDESSAYGLLREGIKGDDTVGTCPAAPARA
jgi:hypothetical protein